MYHQNVEVYSHSPSYILVILLCICIIKANEHYQQDSRTLHHTVVSTCWQFSCLGLGLILGVNHYLVVLYFPASVCQSHPMYRYGLGNVYYCICITHGAVTTRWLHLEDHCVLKGFAFFVTYELDL